MAIKDKDQAGVGRRYLSVDSLGSHAAIFGQLLVLAGDDLSALIASIGATKTQISVVGQVLVTNDLTIPANVSTDVRMATLPNFSISSGKTFTINGPYSGFNGQHFTGSGSVVLGIGFAKPEWFGAVFDGITDDGATFNKAVSAIAAIGGIIECTPGKIYGVSGSNRIRLKSNITLNLNSSKIQRVTIGGIRENIIENYNYDGSGVDTDIAVINGTVKGSGVDTATQTITLSATGFTAFVPGDIGKDFTDAQSDPQNGTITAYDNTARTVTISGAQNLTGACTTTTGTGAGTFVSTTNVLSNTIPAANIYFYGVNRFRLENLKFETSNGDNFGWRRSHNGICKNIRGGSFGRNGCSPTSGLNNRFVDIDMTEDGLVGSNPGECFDVENDSATEISTTFWVNVKSKSITFVDFFNAPGDDFGHEAQFSNCQFTGGSPQTFRVIASNNVNAKNFIIGDSCRIAIGVNTATALLMSNVNGIRCMARLVNDDPAGQGSSSAIRCGSPIDQFIFMGAIHVDGFGTGLDTSTYPITNSRFLNTHLGDTKLIGGSDSNRFIGCKIGVLTITDSDSNQFKDCGITGTTTITRSALNDFTGGENVDLVFDDATTVNNRFRTDHRITGTKTFNNSSTWLGQVFERDGGNLVPTISGSSSGDVTTSVAKGKWWLEGDMLHFYLSITWTATTGVGYQKIFPNFPNSIVPADSAGNPSRWVVNLFAYNFAFTGSYLAADISGGVNFLVPYGISNAGVATAVPATTASGVYESITGFFLIR